MTELMTQPRLYLFDPNLKQAGGHYLGYALRVAQAAEALNVDTTIVANVQAERGLSNARMIPALELDYWLEMCPPAGKEPHDHLSESAERLARTLDRMQHEESWSDSDILFFPYINLAEVMALARWKRHAGITPRTVLLFRRDLDEQGIDAGIGSRAGTGLLRQALADLHACPGCERIRLFTDSDNLSEEHSQALRRRFQTAPIPVDPALFTIRPPRNGNGITLVYLGDARIEKGYATLPSIAQAFRTELTSGSLKMVLQSNFNVPGGEPGIGSARDFLSTMPNVTLLRNSIAEEKYNELLLSADLILLPYKVEKYIARTSGILAEAICAGVPAIVPQGTWLADQVRRHGAGTVYQALDPEGPSRAVSEALGTLDVLRCRAEDRRTAYAHFHRPSRLAEFVCGTEAIRWRG
jgi:glycosyltransferase involved in cell wall biosynthesis